MSKLHYEERPAEFCIIIDFEKGSPNPSRVFRTLSDLIEAFQKFDNHLLGNLRSVVRPRLVLEHVSSGSVKVWLKQFIEAVDDESLKKGDWKGVIGHYLVKGKYVLLNHLENKTEISPKELEVLEAELVEAADDVIKSERFQLSETITREQLLKDITNITKSTKYLRSGDHIHYDSYLGNVGVNTAFQMSEEQMRELLAPKQGLSSISEMIIKVKRPDFLGETKWEFRYDKKIIVVNIVDNQWLETYYEGEVVLRPQDALHVLMETTVSYDSNHEVISTDYKALKIVKILPRQKSTPLNLLQPGRPNINTQGLNEPIGTSRVVSRFNDEDTLN